MREEAVDPLRPEPYARPTRPSSVRALPRPRVGVALAAGRSERLREVTGGGSKALVKLGGLRLVERAVRSLLSAGVERVVVVVGYHAGPVAAVAQRAAPGQVHVVEADDWEEGNGASLCAAEEAVSDEPSFLLVSADHVFSDAALSDLVESGAPALLVDPAPDDSVLDEATKVRVDADGRILELGKHLPGPTADCGAFLLPREVFAAAREARASGDGTLSAAVTHLGRETPVMAVPLRTGAWWQDVDTPQDLRRAGRLFRRSLPRPGDGPVARLLNRRLSIPISWALAPLRPSPDVLSIVSFLIGLVGAWLLARGEGVLGGVLVQACSVVDGVDGEVARLTLRAGPRGTLWDGFLDRLGDVAVCAGLGLWALDAGHGSTATVLWLVAATAGAVLSMATKDRVAALGLEPPSERRIAWLLGGRDGRLLLVFILALAGEPLWALAVTASTSLVSAALRVGFARNPPP